MAHWMVVVSIFDDNAIPCQLNCAHALAGAAFVCGLRVLGLRLGCLDALSLRSNEEAKIGRFWLESRTLNRKAAPC